MKIKRVLHIITDLNTGGAEMMLYTVFNYLNNKDLESSIIVLMGKSSLSDKFDRLGINIEYLYLDKEKIPNIQSLIRLYSYTKMLKPEIIHGWMYHSNLAALFLKIILPKNIKIYWNIRQTLYKIEYEKYFSRLVIKISAFFSRYINKIIYNSVVSKEQHEKYGFSGMNSVIIYNGFDVNIFKPNKSKGEKLRAQYGIPNNSVIVGHIARFHPMKNHKMVIQLASRILNEHKNVWFILVGNNVDKNNKELVDLIIENKIKSRLLMLGEQNLISDLFSSIDILISLSSWGEGFPNVIGEAMCSGLPIVATDVGESRMIVGEYGSIVEPNNIIDAVREINEYIDMDRSNRNRLGLKGRDFIIKHFSIENIGTEYYQLYSLR